MRCGLFLVVVLIASCGRDAKQIGSRQAAQTEERLTPIAGGVAKPGAVNRPLMLPPVSAVKELAKKEPTWTKLSDEDREAARIKHKKSVLGD